MLSYEFLYKCSYEGSYGYSYKCSYECSYKYSNEYWHERVAFQQSAFVRLTAGNDVVATIIIILFLFFFLLRHVLSNLFSESCLELPINQGQTPFQTLSGIFDFAGGAALKAVSECPLRRQACIHISFNMKVCINVLMIFHKNVQINVYKSVHLREASQLKNVTKSGKSSKFKIFTF